MLRVIVWLLVLVIACGDDDGGGSGTGVSGSGGSSGAGATGGSAGTGGSGGSGGTGGTAGAAGTGGMAGAMSDASVDADVFDATTDADLLDAAIDADVSDASFEDASIDAAMDANTNVTDADVHINDGGSDANAIDAGADSGDVPDASVYCQPGHYVGSMRGTYTTTAWGNGQTPLVLQTESSPGAPGLDLWLASATTPCAPGAEFCPDLDVTMGIARFVVAVPGLAFDAIVTGALDCSTGEFRGNLAANGILGSLSFSGPMLASYDAEHAALTNGAWSVTDNTPQCSGCGGSGTWSAMWIDSPWNDDDAGDVSDGGPSSTPCAGGEVCRTSSTAMAQLPEGQGFCAPDDNTPLPPTCSVAGQACGPSGGTCVDASILRVCLRLCDLPN